MYATKKIADLKTGDVVDILPAVEYIHARIDAHDPKYAEKYFSYADYALAESEFATVEKVKSLGGGRMLLHTDLLDMAVEGHILLPVAIDDE